MGGPTIVKTGIGQGSIEPVPAEYCILYLRFEKLITFRLGLLRYNLLRLTFDNVNVLIIISGKCYTFLSYYFYVEFKNFNTFIYIELYNIPEDSKRY